MAKVAIYARLGVYGNHDFCECLEVIKNKGYEKPMLFIDIDEDGYDFDRPEFKRMMTCVKEGIVDFVITPSILQFTRNMSDALEIMEIFKKKHTSIYFVDIKMGSEDFDKDSESFIKLLDNVFQVQIFETYGNNNEREEELASKKDNFEMYIDDFQIVDEALFDKEGNHDA